MKNNKMFVVIEGQEGEEFNALEAAALASKLRNGQDESRYYRHASGRANNTTPDDSELLKKLATYFAAKNGDDAEYLSRRLHGLCYRG